MNPSIEIMLQEDSATDVEIGRLGRELSGWINQNVQGCEAAQKTEVDTEPGGKGVELTVLDTLVLALINRNVVNDLVNCLKAYITERRRTVSLKVVGGGGGITLDAANLESAELSNLVEQIRTMVRGSGQDESDQNES